MARNTTKSSETSLQAIEDADRHAMHAPIDSVPMPESGSHAHSPAAHLGASPKEHTKPTVNQHIGTTRDQSRTRSK